MMPRPCLPRAYPAHSLRLCAPLSPCERGRLFAVVNPDFAEETLNNLHPSSFTSFKIMAIIVQNARGN